eukprot:Awhi_evm1s11007
MSENIEDGDLDVIIFNLSSNFNDVSDSTDVDSDVDVSVPVVVGSNSVALTKLHIKKNLFI